MNGWKRKAVMPLLAVALLLFMQGARANAADDSYSGLKEVSSADAPLVIENEDLALGKDAVGNVAVLLAKDGGQIKVTGGSLTNKSPSDSVGVARADNGKIELNNVAIETEGNDTRLGLDALLGGEIVMNGGSISTTGNTSHAVSAINDGVVTLDGTVIETHGGYASGLYNGFDGSISMKNGSITTYGTGEPGLKSILMAVNVLGGEVSLDHVTVKTTGKDSAFGLASDGLRGEGYDPYLNAVGTIVETAGNTSYGVAALRGGSLDFTDGTITTTGNDSHGVVAFAGGAKATMNGGTVTTTGEASHGGYSYSGSELHIHDADIVTENTGSFGLDALASSLSMEGGTVHTKGAGAHGAVSEAYEGTGGDVSLSNTAIKTEGDGSHGVVAKGGSTVTMQDGGTVEVKGAASYALYSEGSGAIDAQSGNYQISGDIVNGGIGAVSAVFADGSVVTGGTAMLDSGTIDYKMAGNALWNMTKNSQLTSLEMNGADASGPVVDMTRDGNAFGTLTTGALSGTGGTFRMDTDIATESADRVVVSGTTDGSKLLDVVDKGSAETTGKERTILVETADKGGSFALTNGTVDAGAWKYALRSSDDERGRYFETGGQYWELYAEGPSDPGEGGPDTFMGTYYLNYAETDTLMKRLGDLRGDAEHGGWFRGFGGNMDSDAREFAGAFDMDYWGMQVGYDNKLDRDKSWFKNGDTYVGGFIGVSNGDLDFGQNGGTGDLENHTMGMYATYIGDNGFYVDSIAKYVWSKNEFTAHDSAGTLVQGGKINTGGVGLSLEMGKRIRFNNESKKDGNWYVEPQVQLSWQHMGGDTFHASNGLDIGVDDFNSLIGRVGALVGYESKDTNIYVKASYLKEFDGDMDVHGNDAIMSDSLEGSWWVYGIGITRKMNERNSLYFDLERASGDEFDQDWNINAGWRISF